MAAGDHSPGFLRVVNEAKSRIAEITVEELVQRRGPDGLTVVDVREDLEFAAGRIPGAVHVGKGVLERDAESTWPDPTTPLVLYCGGGFRSALAADALQQLGYTRVLSLAGGFRAWGDSGAEIERDSL